MEMKPAVQFWRWIPILITTLLVLTTVIDTAQVGVSPVFATAYASEATAAEESAEETSETSSIDSPGQSASLPDAVEEAHSTLAWGQSLQVPGSVFQFDESNPYRFTQALESNPAGEDHTYGSFSISGIDLKRETDESRGVPGYTISSGSISIRYTYIDKWADVPVEEERIAADASRTVDVFTLDRDIQHGAIILQTSMDRLNWYNVAVQTNAFQETPVQIEAFYHTTDVEMLNGCYYRLIVVYKTVKKVSDKKWLWVFDKEVFSNKRYAEVYEFYAAAHNSQIETINGNTMQYSLGETVKVADAASYAGEVQITGNDMHYGWRLGEFFVSGFTSYVKQRDSVVILKNPGDVVTLWFRLSQNINALNNEKSLTIDSDPAATDQYFQTARTKFGRGMLIIRKTDYENVKHPPVLYQDYLEANTLLGNNNRVQLFEEGDYEVALDYKVKKHQPIFPQEAKYRIFFQFSVRNANSMVYPFDVKTGAELTAQSATPNGFRLDLARSRYLDIYIKKEVWAEGTGGLTEDTRFNTAAKDGDTYTQEGIYTITARNQYTGRETIKRIYVGNDPNLSAQVEAMVPLTQRRADETETERATGQATNNHVLRSGEAAAEYADASNEPAAPLAEQVTAQGLHTRSIFPIVGIIVLIIAIGAALIIKRKR